MENSHHASNLKTSWCFKIKCLLFSCRFDDMMHQSLNSLHRFESHLVYRKLKKNKHTWLHPHPTDQNPAQSEVRVRALPWQWRWWRWARRYRPAVCGRTACCCGPPCMTNPPWVRRTTPRDSYPPSPPPRAALWGRCRRCPPLQGSWRAQAGCF